MYTRLSSDIASKFRLCPVPNEILVYVCFSRNRIKFLLAALKQSCCCFPAQEVEPDLRKMFSGDGGALPGDGMGLWIDAFGCGPASTPGHHECF